MRVVITDSNFQTDLPEREVLKKVGLTPERYSCATEQEMIEAGRDADVVLVQFAPVTRGVLETWENCKLIVRYGIGYDNIDVKAAEELNIQVCNVPSYCLDEVADHTCALILSAQRKIVAFHESVKGGIWDVQKTAGSIPRFSESVIGLVGFGRIGERVMRRLQPFGCRFKVYDPYFSEEEAQEHGLDKVGSLQDVLSQSDIVTLHVPLTKETHHLMNRTSLQWMKPNALLVNTSRGALIDTMALAEALGSGQVGGAALDVFESEPFESEHPLRLCSNVIFTPHAAYFSDSALHALQQQAAEEVVRWVKGEQPASPVNRPVSPRRRTQWEGYRER